MARSGRLGRVNGDEPVVQMATRIPKDVHRALRLRCVQDETSVQAFVTEALAAKLARMTARR